MIKQSWQSCLNIYQVFKFIRCTPPKNDINLFAKIQIKVSIFNKNIGVLQKKVPACYTCLRDIPSHSCYTDSHLEIQTKYWSNIRGTQQEPMLTPWIFILLQIFIKLGIQWVLFQSYFNYRDKYNPSLVNRITVLSSSVGLSAFSTDGWTLQSLSSAEW